MLIMKCFPGLDSILVVLVWLLDAIYTICTSLDDKFLFCVIFLFYYFLLTACSSARCASDNTHLKPFHRDIMVVSSFTMFRSCLCFFYFSVTLSRSIYLPACLPTWTCLLIFYSATLCHSHLFLSIKPNRAEAVMWQTLWLFRLTQQPIKWRVIVKTSVEK